MILEDQVAPFAFLRGFSPLTGTDNTAFVSQIIDTQLYTSVTFVLATGTLADADATSAVLVEHGDASNLSDAAAVPDTMLLPSGTGQEASMAPIFSDDDVVRAIGYNGDKRYVRYTLTPAGNSGSFPASCVVVCKKRLQGTLN